MYCKFCGNENENGYAFCAYCGRELKKSGSLNAYGSDEKAAENYSAKEDAGIIGNSCNEDGSCAEHTVYDDKNDGQSSRDWEFDTTKEDNAGSSGTDASSLGKPDVNDEDNKNSYTYKKNKKRPGRKKAAAAGIIAAAAIIIIIIIAAAAGKKTKIDVTDYITVEFDGADGYGTAEISGEDEWAVEVGLLLIEEGGYEKALEWAVSLSDVSVTYELSQAEGLSNGDIVTVTAVIENADVSGLPVKLTASEVKVERNRSLPGAANRIALTERVYFGNCRSAVTPAASDRYTGFFGRLTRMWAASANGQQPDRKIPVAIRHSSTGVNTMP